MENKASKKKTCLLKMLKIYSENRTELRPMKTKEKNSVILNFTLILTNHTFSNGVRRGYYNHFVHFQHLFFYFFLFRKEISKM